MTVLRPVATCALRPFAALALCCLVLLSACGRYIEPAADPSIRLRLEAAVGAHDALFQSLTTTPEQDRAPRYAALRVQIESIKLSDVQRAAARASAPAPATASFLNDYLRNLDWLRERDLPGQPPAREFTALRHAAMTDALSDALFYETTVLNRTR